MEALTAARVRRRRERLIFLRRLPTAPTTPHHSLSPGVVQHYGGLVPAARPSMDIQNHNLRGILP